MSSIQFNCKSSLGMNLSNSRPKSTSNQKNKPLDGYSEGTKRRVLSLLAHSTLSKRQQQELLACIEKSPADYYNKKLENAKLKAPHHSLPVALPSVLKSTLQSKELSNFPKVSLSTKSAAGLRTREQILQQCDVYKVDPYRTKPTRNREKEIERLQIIMSNQTLNQGSNIKKLNDSKEKCPDKPLDPIVELSKEIEERMEWYKEMQKLGQGKQYQSQIQYEIQIRRKELEKLKNKVKDTGEIHTKSE